MSLTLSRPTVVDLAVLANAMSAEERRQYETATGLPHSADGVARSVVLFGGVEYLALDDAGNPVSAFGCFPLGGGVWQTWMVSRHDAFALHGRALSRLLDPEEGSVVLDGRDIRDLPSRTIARRLQSPAPNKGRASAPPLLSLSCAQLPCNCRIRSELLSLAGAAPLPPCSRSSRLSSCCSTGFAPASP